MSQPPNPAPEPRSGLGVASLVRSLPPLSEIDGAALRDRLVELERARNIVEAEQAQVMAELHRRAADADAARDAALAPRARAMVPAHEARLVEFVADEIAVLLVSTRMLASHRLDAALDITGHQALTDSWGRGLIDARKAGVIATGLRDVDPAFADVLGAEACDYATAHTAPQTRAWLARRVITADPGAAEIRRARASEGRRVTLTPLADGMAELTALLPGIQARQAHDTLTALANHSNAGRGVAPPTLAAGAAAAPAAGHGDAPLTVAGSRPPKDTRTMDQRRADALMDLLTGRAEPPRVSIQVVVPADTLTGDADLPAVIPGLGPITAHEARRIASGPGQTSYRRLVVDVDTGAARPPAVPAIERRYRPSVALDRAVRARDLTCRFPGCRRSAVGQQSGTDLDHSVPWPAGPTAWSNLVALCRHHHRLKHSAGWTTDLSPDGTLTWTMPTGQPHSTHPWHYIDPPDTS
jgi:hypothetical protein